MDFKHLVTRKLIWLGFLSILFLGNIQAQDTLNFAERRFSFAEGSLGADFEFIPGGTGESFYINSNGDKIPFNFNPQFTPRFTITGLHFWRNVDFYITVPVTNFLNREVDEVKSNYATGAETGVKFYPWKVKENSIRPYAGISWNLTNYSQEVNEEVGQFILRSQAPLQFGLTYNRNDKLIEIGGSYNYQNEVDYYLSRTQKETIQLPPLSFHVSYRWIFDSSIKDAPELYDGTIDRQVEALRKLKKLSSFSFALGFSSSFMGSNDYNEQNYPFLDNMKISNSHFDFGVGYYHEGLDAHANLTFRNIPFQLDGFDFEQKYTRRTVGLELYKFLFDYHGFVPYLGIIPSYETHTFVNTDSGNEILNHSENKWTAGLIFGWDIRQDERQTYILRTNLRYYPMRLNIEGTDYRFNQFEFNFIQFVFYPTRYKWIKKARRGEVDY